MSMFLFFWCLFCFLVWGSFTVGWLVAKNNFIKELKQYAQKYDEREKEIIYEYIGEVEQE